MVDAWQRVFEYFFPLESGLIAATECVLRRSGRHSTRFRIAYQLACTQQLANSLGLSCSGFSLYRLCGFPPRSSDAHFSSSRSTPVQPSSLSVSGISTHCHLHHKPPCPDSGLVISQGKRRRFRLLYRTKHQSISLVNLLVNHGRHQLVHRESSRWNDERIRFLAIRQEKIRVHNRNVFVFIRYGDAYVPDRADYDGCVPEDLWHCLLEPARPAHGDHGWRERFERFESCGVFPRPRSWAFGSCISSLV